MIGVTKVEIQLGGIVWWTGSCQESQATSDGESDGRGVKLQFRRVDVPRFRFYAWKPKLIESRSSTNSTLFEQHPLIGRIRQHRNFTFHAHFGMTLQSFALTNADAFVTVSTR
jgi:hypothetical protein